MKHPEWAIHAETCKLCRGNIDSAPSHTMAWGFQKKVKGVWTLLRFTCANKDAVVRRFGPDTSTRRVIRVAIIREKDL